MKTHLRFMLLVLLISYSCNNDDDNNIQTCTQQGWAYSLDNTSLNTIDETVLNTDYFHHYLGPGTGPAVEIWKVSGLNKVVFLTTVITAGATGQGDLSINGNPIETVDVTCVVGGSTVGSLMRFTVSGTYNNQMIEGEFCVVIDDVIP